MTAPRLLCHFIVHGDYSHIRRALDSLAQTTSTPHRVVVTINTGEAPELDALRREYPQVAWRVNETPQGFAVNHNCALQTAAAEDDPPHYVALLNDDIRLHPGAMDALAAYLDANPDVALVGPALQNPDGSSQISSYADPSLPRALYKVSGLASLTHQGSGLRRLLLRSGVMRLLNVEAAHPPEQTRDVPVIKGAVMVVRLTAATQVGGMDEVTRAYGEEFGWHLRLRRAGLRVVRVGQAAVTHYGQGQARLRLRGWVLAEDRLALVAYFSRYRPRWEAGLLRAVVIVVHGIYALLWWPLDRDRSRDHRAAAAVGWRRLS